MSQAVQLHAQEIFAAGARIEPYVDKRDHFVSPFPGQSKETVAALYQLCTKDEWERLTASPVPYPEDTRNWIRLITRRINYNIFVDGDRKDVIYAGPLGNDAFKASWAINRCPAEEMQWRDVEQWVCAEATPYTPDSAYGVVGKLVKYRFVYISPNPQDNGLKEVVLYHHP